MGNRVHAKVTLAIETAKAALAQITEPVDLSGLWRHFDWQLIEPNGGLDLVKLTIRLWDADATVVTLRDDSPLHNGKIVCHVQLADRTWCCTFRQVGNRLEHIHTL